MMPGTDIGIQIQKLRDVHAKNFTHPWTDADWERIAELVPVFEGDAEPMKWNRAPGPELT